MESVTSSKEDPADQQLEGEEQRRGKEGIRSQLVREALDFRAGCLTSITHMDDCDLQDPRPMGMPDFGEDWDSNAMLEWRR